MKKIFLLFLIFTSLSLASNESYFLTHPSLSPNADKIVFSFEGDIWRMDIDGSNAVRLTAMDGRETDPVYSPDGKWIAFTGRQEGNANVYFMSANGGEIKQLTYHDSHDKMENWSWDSKEVYFTSGRYNDVSAYSVSVTGGTPKRFFEPFFNWPHNFVKHPSKNEYFFNETWESQGYASRKRYKGDFNPDIKSYNTDTKEFKQYTKYDGKDLWPTLDEKGNIYFASDEANGEYNLYTFVNDKKTALTSFSTSILKPRVSVNGEKIVFEKDYQIYVYDVASKKSEKIKTTLFSNNTLKLHKEFNVSGKISAFDVSPDNKKIAFVSRGELFVSDIKGKFVRHIKTNPVERVLEVNWLKDNKTLLITRTHKGWENIFTILADGSKKEVQRTKEKRNNRRISLNKDKTKALFNSGRDELKIIDLKDFESKTIVKDEFWALRPDKSYFSPDDRYVLYSAFRNFERDVFVYDIKKEKSYNLTYSGVTEGSPFWGPKGKYIYFVSDRYKPSYPRGTNDTEIFRLALVKHNKPFKSDKFDKLFTKAKKDSSKPFVEIDFENIDKRWELVVDFPLNQFGLFVTKDKENDVILYTSNHDNAGWGLFKTVLKPFDKKESKRIKGAKFANTEIKSAKKNYYVLCRGTIKKLNLAGNKTSGIKISYKFKRNLKEEFEQMFNETFVNVEENFYDEKFHGEDWFKVKKQYEKYIPHLTSRDDLRRLINDMLGELNSSHQNFYSNGKEESSYYRTRSLSTGILFDNENPYMVSKVVPNSAADKAGVNIFKGDQLVAVNGNPVTITENREKYFNAPSLSEEVSLTFKRKGKTFDVKIHPVSSRTIYNALYENWIDENQKKVDKASNKRIAYIHMRNMGAGELSRFKIEIANELIHRDALILDLRHNRGGNVHDDVLQILSQKRYADWKYREGRMAKQPNFTPSDKPIILLIDEQSLSDAEVTSAGFKALKLGKIIGTETYRWIIFTSGRGLVDGSFYRLPSWGCYHVDGRDMEWHGVKPDIYIKTTFKDKMEGNDPPLKRAIEEIMKDLK